MSLSLASLASLAGPAAGRRDAGLKFARLALLGVIVGGAAAGWLVNSPAAAHLAMARDGADLARLLRFMAGVKLLLAGCACAAVFWRLAAPVSAPWFAAYALAAGAMAAGPGMIWGLAHVGLGAVFLHGGLFATILLLWRDPGMAARLADVAAYTKGH